MPASLRNLLKVVNNGNLIITPRFELWLMNHNDDPLPEPIAQRIYDLLVTPPRNRAASFSASSAGQCLRRQVYTYLGVPTGDTIDPRLARIFADGKWRHLRYQAQLLHAGLITDIEVPLQWQNMRDRGTMDGMGIVPDDHPREAWRGKSFGLELKGAFSSVARKILAEGPDKFARQYHRYFLSGGWDLFVILVENKDTQELSEWVVEPNPALIAEQRRELTVLNKHVDQQRLPKMLPDCANMTGPIFKDCPFGGKHGPCVTLKNYQQSIEHAQEGGTP